MQEHSNNTVEQNYTTTIEGLAIHTGDLLCTTDGNKESSEGAFWWIVGKLIPGPVDHIVICVDAKERRFVEAGPNGVISFQVQGEKWESEKMKSARGFIDRMYGAVNPFEAYDIPSEQKIIQREQVANFCTDQLGKPYNLNFLDSEQHDSFYCSQLAYAAFSQIGINLNQGLSIPAIYKSERIVYPTEIWEHGVSTEVLSFNK